MFSGRGIGVPIGGAVDGSADGSKYLGRPRRPRMSGELGSPSQSADSGFSSRLAVVNKNFELPELKPMFPEQVGPEDNNYIESISEGSKLITVEELILKALSEDASVENSTYSLIRKDIENSGLLSEDDHTAWARTVDHVGRNLRVAGNVTVDRVSDLASTARDEIVDSVDYEIPGIDRTSRELWDIALDVGGEIVRDTSASVIAMVPVIGTGAAASFVYINMRELRSEQARAISALNQLITNGRVVSKKLTSFDFYGPTCDSMDYMKGPFILPNNIKENDYIELGQLGAYGLTFRTDFNGLYSNNIFACNNKKNTHRI